MRRAILIVLVCFIASCNNITQGPRNVSVDRYIKLINKTGVPNLQIYVSNSMTCANYGNIVAVLADDGYYFVHVSPGETKYIIYCTPIDVVCGSTGTECNSKKIIGVESQASDVDLD